MQIHYLSEQNSILNHFLAQIRDIHVQNDQLRFRKNMERIGEIMAYEISKSLAYKNISVETPLGVKQTTALADKIVVCSILRAGLVLHGGFINYFDSAENGFISAFRYHYKNDDDFEVRVEYRAAPSFKDKIILLVDPMLATGQSITSVIQKLNLDSEPKEVHIAVVVAAPEGIGHLEKNLPDSYHLWVASLDEKLNEKNYIVPGLGDAGDLAFGQKL